MDIVDAVKSAFQRYFDFSGRSSRAAFWYFMAFVIGGLSLLPFIDGFLFGTGPVPLAGPWASFGFPVAHGPLSALFGLACFIPWLSVSTRRLHDVGRPGWWMYFGFIPPFGWMFMMVWLTREGVVGENEHGPDPLAGQGVAGHA